MKVFGSISRLVSVLFRKNSQDLTLRPNQATTYSAARDTQFPPGDTDHVLVSATSTQTLTNKTLSGNTATNLVSGSGTFTFNTTGTVTAPNTTDTLVGKATTDTFTNKTFDADGTGNSITNIENADIKAAAAIDATKIANGSVSNTEFQYLDGVTSAIQGQLDAKASITYVDNLVNGLSWKNSVRAATTTNGTLATAFENGDTIDGVTLATGDRILLKDQTASENNGIYTVNASGAPTRAVDMDSALEFSGSAVFVREGTANADKAFVETLEVVTVGTDPVSFTQFSGSSNAATRNLDNLTVSSLAVGSLLVGTSTTQVSNLAIGASGTKLTSNGTTATWVDNSFEATWTTGDGTTKAVTHSLGTKDVQVQVYDMSNDETIFVDTVIRTSTSVVTLTSSEAPGGSSWRVLITAQ